MGKKQKIDNFCNSQQLYLSSQDENDSNNSDIFQCIQKSPQKKQIKKKKKTYPKQKSVWTEAHDIRYFMFYLKFKTDHPYFQISWLDWKVDNVYDKMADFINLDLEITSKDKKQCKSADQRLKKIHFLEYQKYQLAQTDIIQTSFQKIQKYLQSHPEDLQCGMIFKNFNKKRNEKSNHMKLCEKYIQINQLKMKSAENLYHQIMNSNLQNTMDQSNFETRLSTELD